MDIFLARQPIFDSAKKVYGYEILYRSGYSNQFADTDADMATATVIINTFQTFGLDVLTNNKPVFINFTENLLNQEIATIIPKESLVIEVLETVLPSQNTVATCRELKRLGYVLALDDFVYKPDLEPLIDLADIIKVDFIQSSPAEIETLTGKLRNRKVLLLAEKIENNEMFEFSRRLGFSLFQGFFFSKPEILTSKGISPLKATYLQLMSKLNQEELDFSAFAMAVSRDLSLTYNLLRLVNSAAFGFRSKIHSVKHALVLLGEREIRKWLSLMLLHDLGKNKPDELVRHSLIRARFAELVSLQTEFKNQSDNLFLAGLFSLLDVILNRPLTNVLQELQPPDAVKDCLLDPDKEIGRIYRIILAYERGHWKEVMDYADAFAIEYKDIIAAYLAALRWYNEITADE